MRGLPLSEMILALSEMILHVLKGPLILLKICLQIHTLGTSQERTCLKHGQVLKAAVLIKIILNPNLIFS